MKTLTPAELKFLLHCFTSPDNTDYDLAPFKELAEAWIASGILRRDSPWGSTPAAGYIYRATPLGEAWIKTILATPLPTAAFIDANGRVIA